ncbi:MAG: hypothetical protein R3D30_14280 [Hyphomicrobiales bacterium]
MYFSTPSTQTVICWSAFVDGDDHRRIFRELGRGFLLVALNGLGGLGVGIRLTFGFGSLQYRDQD